MTNARSEEERNLATAEALYAATGSDDWDAAEAMLSDDLVITEADTLPYAGVYRGKGGLRELYRKVLSSSLGGASIAVKGRTAGGNNVVYLLELELPDGGPPLELVEVFHFGPDGKVVEIKPFYFDSDAVNRACGVVTTSSST
jgi:ketosteroid isomerase-like protein